jgi:hypothetical protein
MVNECYWIVIFKIIFAQNDFTLSKGNKCNYVYVMDRLQTSGELQDKTSFIDPSTNVDLLKGCSLDYLLL